MASLPLTSCVLNFNPSTQCDDLNILYVGKNLNIDKTSDRSTFLSVNVRNVYSRTNNQPDALVSPSISTFSISCTCANAVVEAHYYIYSNSQNSIDSISVDVIVSSFNSCDTIQVPQAYSVNFVTNTSEVVYRSGNPGYQIGKNIITGYYSSANDITYYDAGFQIPGINSDGSCGTTTLSNSPFLLFGKDTVFNCFVSFNYTGLQNFCTSTQTIPSLLFNNDLLTLLGKYGNINHTYSNDWVVINNGTSSTSFSFNSITGVCSLNNLLAYYITYANIGNVLNPQFKIIYAQRDFVENTYWQFTLSDKTQLQKFYYTLSVNFVHYPLQISKYFPPAPNPLPVMPDDILYPFKVSSADVICMMVALLNI